MNRPEVTAKEVIIKRYHDHELFANEWKFYLYYSEFCPELLGVDPQKKTLVIEKCTPILDLHKKNSGQFKKQLWTLLEKLHAAGANHRDVSLKNVVIKDNKVLLIDWENATTDIGKVSADLYGAKAAGVDPQSPDVWWEGPWGHCPGRYWK